MLVMYPTRAISTSEEVIATNEPYQKSQLELRIDALEHQVTYLSDTQDKQLRVIDLLSQLVDELLANRNHVAEMAQEMVREGRERLEKHHAAIPPFRTHF